MPCKMFFFSRPETSSIIDKDHLNRGQILHLNGYGYDNFCITSCSTGQFGTHYQTINLRTKAKNVIDSFGLLHISQRKDDRIQYYVIDETISEDKVLELEQQNKETEVQEAIAKEKAKLDSANKVEQLKKEFPYLLLAKDSDRSSVVVAATNIRRELKKAFPDTKFSVKSESHSAIRVRWNSDLSKEYVDKLIGKYECGYFDGMDDSYKYSHSEWHIFGSVKYLSLCPEKDFTKEL